MSWVAEHRTVFTYAPDGVNLGVVTGYDQGTRFIVEHVIVLPGAPRATLGRMMRAALHEAWQHYAAVSFFLPPESPWRPFAARLGFVAYAEDLGTWYIAWKS